MPGRRTVSCARLHTLALLRPPWGCRLHWLLRSEGSAVNRKCVQRVYRQDGLSLKRRPRKLVSIPRVPHTVVTLPIERWSMDFVRDALGDGCAFRALTIMDDCTRECVATEVDSSLSGERVVRVPGRLAGTRGLPQGIVCDARPAFAGPVLDQ